VSARITTRAHTQVRPYSFFYHLADVTYAWALPGRRTQGVTLPSSPIFLLPAVISGRSEPISGRLGAISGGSGAISDHSDPIAARWGAIAAGSERCLQGHHGAFALPQRSR